VNADHVVVVASSGAGQGATELTVVLVFGILCVACLVAGIVFSRRGSGRPSVWFGLGAASFIVGAIAVAML
jgi:hypothetical protein